MKSRVWTVFAIATALVSCGDKMQTRDAVERGILKSVSSRGINANSMDVSVTSVKFHGKQADAVVSFAPKGGKISDGLTMRYTLDQRDGEWVITGRSGLDMKQHAGGTPPPSMMDQNSGADTAPPGSLPGAERPLPAGHPPIDGTQK